MLRTSADVAAVRDCTEATGNITIFAPGNVELPNLRSAQGLSVGSDDLTSIRLLALVTVENSIYIGDNPALTTIELPALENAGLFGFSLKDNPLVTTVVLPKVETLGGFKLEVNERLENVSAPLLTAVSGESPAGDFYILTNPALEEIDVPLLERVNGELGVRYNDALTTLALDHLVELGAVFVRDNPALSHLRLPEVPDTLDLDVGGNAALQSIELPQLVSVREDIFIVGNAELTVLDLSSLTTVPSDGAFNISRNPMLPNCRVTDILAQLEGYEGGEIVEDNSSTCP